MGKYLKQQYEERDLAKALAKAHGLIDEEKRKFSDLTLACNRMEKLLRRALCYIDSLGWIESDNGDCLPLYEAIECELNNLCCLERREK